jgi:hypothetical protein
LNTAIKSFPDVFENIYGDVVLEDGILTEMEEIDEDDVLTFTYSLVNIPGSLGKNLIAEDFDENTFYYSKFLRTSDAAKAKAKYNELATQLQSAVITNSFLTGKQKLTGKLFHQILLRIKQNQSLQFPGTAVILKISKYGSG